jgi:hypothetical protein
VARLERRREQEDPVRRLSFASRLAHLRATATAVFLSLLLVAASAAVALADGGGGIVPH